MDDQAIIAAIDRLNEQLKTLPDWLPCAIEGLYPEFDYPDHSPQVYLALVEQEMREVEDKIRVASEGERALLERFCSMLLRCAIALKQAGV